MRLKAEKIEYLSKKIYGNLKALKQMQPVSPPDQIEGTIRRVFTEDLRREDDLEREAEAILKQHQQKISLQNMSYNTLLSRTKQELARKKKIIL